MFDLLKRMVFTSRPSLPELGDGGRCVVIDVHGIGDQDAGFSGVLRSRVEAACRKRGVRVDWQEYLWQWYLQSYQERLRSGPVWMVPWAANRFSTKCLSDAMAVESPLGDVIVAGLVEKIRLAVENGGLSQRRRGAEEEPNPPAPFPEGKGGQEGKVDLVLVAHSEGTVIVWRALEELMGRIWMRRINLRGVVLMGSPLRAVLAARHEEMGCAVAPVPRGARVVNFVCRMDPVIMSDRGGGLGDVPGVEDRVVWPIPFHTGYRRVRRVARAVTGLVVGS